MDRQVFMSELYKACQEFETKWNRGQRGENPEYWPNELPEEEWWEQFIVHITDGE